MWRLRVLNVVGGQNVPWRCKSNLDCTIKIHIWIPSRSFINDCFTELLHHSHWARVEYCAFCNGWKLWSEYYLPVLLHLFRRVVVLQSAVIIYFYSECTYIVFVIFFLPEMFIQSLISTLEIYIISPLWNCDMMLRWIANNSQYHRFLQNYRKILYACAMRMCLYRDLYH